MALSVACALLAVGTRTVLLAISVLRTVVSSIVAVASASPTVDVVGVMPPAAA